MWKKGEEATEFPSNKSKIQVTDVVVAQIKNLSFWIDEDYMNSVFAATYLEALSLTVNYPDSLLFLAAGIQDVVTSFTHFLSSSISTLATTVLH